MSKVKNFYDKVRLNIGNFGIYLGSVLLKVPVINYLFMKIAEPRVRRLVQFAIYICMMFAGIGVLLSPPSSFESIVGLYLVYLFGGFLVLGSLLGGIAVLPGIWWLERAGVLALCTGLAMYFVFVVSLGSSVVGLAVSLAFILTFRQRWTEIKGSQLAPKGL